MNKIQMFLNNPANLELDMGDFNIGLNYSFNDIRDISKRNGSYSKTIVIPGTKNNNFVLGGLFDINADFTLFNPNKKTQAKIVVNSEIVIEGFIHLTNIRKLSNVDTQGNSIFYDMVIYSNSIDLMSELGDAKLQDLTTLDRFNHIYNEANIIASWAGDKGYVYPMIGESSSNSIYISGNFYPAAYYNNVLDAVISQAGYGWGGSLKDNAQFNNEIIPYMGNGTGKVTEYDRTQKEIDVLIDDPTTGTSLSGANANSNTGIPQAWSGVQVLPFNIEVSDPTNQFNTTTSVLDVAVGGNYVLNLDLNYKIVWSKTTLGVASIFGYKFKVTYITQVDSGSGWVAVDTLEVNNIEGPATIPATGSTTDISLAIDFQTPALTFNQGDKVRVVMTAFRTDGAYVEGTPATYPALTTDILFEGTNTLTTTSLNSDVGLGDTVNITSFLPFLKQSDLILDLIKRYNLVIHTDKDNPNILLFDSYNEYYSGNTEVLDWSGKKDYSREDNIKLLSELQFKTAKFTYTADTTVDDINSTYTALFNEVYGQLEVSFDNDFVEGESLIQTPFSPTPSVKTVFGAYLPSISKDEPKGNPRVLYYGGLKTLVGNKTWSFNGNIKTTYPYAGHFDDPMNPTLDLNFDYARRYFIDILPGKLTNNTQYNTYWSAYINQIANGKLLTAYFKLDETDIRKIRNNLSFKVFIKDAYYYINRVYDYNPMQDSVTKVELIKVEDLGNYVDEGFTPIQVVGDEDCPIDIYVTQNVIAGRGVVHFYKSNSNQVINQVCCESYGGIYNAQTLACELPSNYAPSYPNVLPSSVDSRRLVVGTSIDLGDNNVIGGVNVRPILDEDDDARLSSRNNSQIVVGSDNNSMFNNTVIFGDENIVTNDSIAVLNGSGNVVSGFGTTLIGAVSQTVEDSNRVYLGDKFKVDTKTGNRFIGGVRLDETYQFSRRITSSEILELDTTPIELVAAPGSDDYISVISVTCYLDYATTKYEGDLDFEIYTETADEPSFIAEGVLSEEASGIYEFFKYPITPPKTQMALERPLNIKLSAVASDGDSDVIITYSYKIINIAGL